MNNIGSNFIYVFLLFTLVIVVFNLTDTFLVKTYADDRYIVHENYSQILEAEINKPVFDTDHWDIPFHVKTEVISPNGGYVLRPCEEYGFNIQVKAILNNLGGPHYGRFPEVCAIGQNEFQVIGKNILVFDVNLHISRHADFNGTSIPNGSYELELLGEGTKDYDGNYDFKIVHHPFTVEINETKNENITYLFYNNSEIHDSDLHLRTFPKNQSDPSTTKTLLFPEFKTIVLIIFLASSYFKYRAYRR